MSKYVGARGPCSNIKKPIKKVARGINALRQKLMRGLERNNLRKLNKNSVNIKKNSKCDKKKLRKSNKNSINIKKNSKCDKKKLRKSNKNSINIKKNSKCDKKKLRKSNKNSINIKENSKCDKKKLRKSNKNSINIKKNSKCAKKKLRKLNKNRANKKKKKLPQHRINELVLNWRRNKKNDSSFKLFNRRLYPKARLDFILRKKRFLPDGTWYLRSVYTLDLFNKKQVEDKLREIEMKQQMKKNKHMPAREYNNQVEKKPLSPSDYIISSTLSSRRDRARARARARAQNKGSMSEDGAEEEKEPFIYKKPYHPYMWQKNIKFKYHNINFNIKHKWRKYNADFRNRNMKPFYISVFEDYPDASTDMLVKKNVLELKNLKYLRCLSNLSSLCKKGLSIPKFMSSLKKYFNSFKCFGVFKNVTANNYKVYLKKLYLLRKLENFDMYLVCLIFYFIQKHREKLYDACKLNTCKAIHAALLKFYNLKMKSTKYSKKFKSMFKELLQEFSERINYLSTNYSLVEEVEKQVLDENVLDTVLEMCKIPPIKNKTVRVQAPISSEQVVKISMRCKSSSAQSEGLYAAFITRFRKNVSSINRLDNYYDKMNDLPELTDILKGHIDGSLFKKCLAEGRTLYSIEKEYEIIYKDLQDFRFINKLFALKLMFFKYDIEASKKDSKLISMCKDIDPLWSLNIDTQGGDCISFLGCLQHLCKLKKFTKFKLLALISD
jgi:hypothetical protein